MFEIFTDSASNIPKRLIKKYKIHVVPFTCVIDGEEYRCDSDKSQFDYDMFYKALREKRNVGTSMVNTEEFYDAFAPVAKSGRDIMYIGLSSALSGTFDAARSALARLKSQHTQSHFAAIDTLSGSYGEGLVCFYAAKMRENGMNIHDTAHRIKSILPHLRSRFSADDLFYIKRGGRISAATALCGAMLGIKPMLKAQSDGKIIMYDKVRGRKAALDKLVDELIESVDITKHQIVSLSHADCKADADYMVSRLKKLPYISDVLVGLMEPVTATHGGPGMIALFYFAKEN